MKEFIEAIKSGNLVEVKKQFNTIMENRTESLRKDLRVQIAEEVKIDGEESDEDDDDKDEDDKDENQSKKDKDKEDDKEEKSDDKSDKE